MENNIKNSGVWNKLCYFYLASENYLDDTQLNKLVKSLESNEVDADEVDRLVKGLESYADDIDDITECDIASSIAGGMKKYMDAFGIEVVHEESKYYDCVICTTVFKADGRFYKFCYTYASGSGDNFDDTEIKEVFPRTVEVVIYE